MFSIFRVSCWIFFLAHNQPHVFFWFSFTLLIYFRVCLFPFWYVSCLCNHSAFIVRSPMAIRKVGTHAQKNIWRWTLKSKQKQKQKKRNSDRILSVDEGLSCLLVLIKGKRWPLFFIWHPSLRDNWQLSGDYITASTAVLHNYMKRVESKLKGNVRQKLPMCVSSEAIAHAGGSKTDDSSDENELN